MTYMFVMTIIIFVWLASILIVEHQFGVGNAYHTMLEEVKSDEKTEEIPDWMIQIVVGAVFFMMMPYLAYKLITK